MDAGRFCYRAPCQFQIGGPVGEIHWYWASEEAAVYLEPHAFPRMAGFRQFKITEGVGERFVQFPRHVSGVAPPGVEEISVDGTREQFLGLSVYGPIIWGDLPNCRFPVVFNDNIVNIDADVALAPITAGIELDAVPTIRESGLVVIELPAERMVETACIELGFSGVPGEGGVLLLDASTSTAVESAGLDIDAETFDDEAPVDPDDEESIVFDLAAETVPNFPPAVKVSAELLIEGEARKAGERAEVDIYASDSGIPPDEENSRILISEQTSNILPGGSGSGGGGGGEEETGPSCSEAIHMEMGVEYTFDDPDFSPQHWFQFWDNGDLTYTIAYRTNSGDNRNVVAIHGVCSAEAPFHSTFEELISWDYGPSGTEEWIQLLVPSMMTAGNFTLRVTAE